MKTANDDGQDWARDYRRALLDDDFPWGRQLVFDPLYLTSFGTDVFCRGIPLGFSLCLPWLCFTVFTLLSGSTPSLLRRQRRPQTLCKMGYPTEIGGFNETQATALFASDAVSG